MTEIETYGGETYHLGGSKAVSINVSIASLEKLLINVPLLANIYLIYANNDLSKAVMFAT